MDGEWAGLKLSSSIVYSNNSDIVIHGAALWSNVRCTNICTSFTNDLTAIGNTNNITNNPCFANWAGKNFRLAADSPCVNKGLNLDWMTNAVNLDGRKRLRYGTVDMGAYELIYDGTIYKFH